MTANPFRRDTPLFSLIRLTIRHRIVGRIDSHRAWVNQLGRIRFALADSPRLSKRTIRVGTAWERTRTASVLVRACALATLVTGYPPHARLHSCCPSSTQACACEPAGVARCLVSSSREHSRLATCFLGHPLTLLLAIRARDISAHRVTLFSRGRDFCEELLPPPLEGSWPPEQPSDYEAWH
jgi:hypothetical protein